MYIEHRLWFNGLSKIQIYDRERICIIDAIVLVPPTIEFLGDHGKTNTNKVYIYIYISMYWF